MSRSEGSQRWPLLALLAVAQFMLILDVTVVNVALPSIRGELDPGREALTWVVAAYALTFGGLMVLGGRIADRVGARRTLLAGLALFTLASLAGGLATSAGVLIAARAVQGVGAALLSPSALAILATTFHGRERHRALGVWAAIGGGGAAAGVLIGGLLASGPGWRWVFFVNLPVGIAVLLALPALVAAVRPAVRTRIDLPGAMAITAGTALLVYGLTHAGDSGWFDVGTVVPLGLAILSYVVFAGIERRVRSPLIPARLVAQRPVVSGAFVMLVATGLMIAFFFLCSLYLQQVLDLSALRTGLVFLPVAITITIGSHLGGRLVGRLGVRPIAFTGFLLTAVGATLLTGLSDRSDTYAVLPGFLLAALGLGPLFVVATSTALARVGHHEAGLASGVVNTFHELGGAIGVAVASTIAAASLGPGAGGTGGFTSAFLVAAITAAIGAVLAPAVLPGGKPAVVTGHAH